MTTINEQNHRCYKCGEALAPGSLIQCAQHLAEFNINVEKLCARVKAAMKAKEEKVKK